MRSTASGAPELTSKVAAFHARTEALITAALRDERVAANPAEASERERRLVHSMLLVWFASLTGWASGLHATADIVAHTRSAAELMLEPGGPL